MKVGVYWNQSMFQPLSPGQTPHRASWTPSVKGATSSRPQEGSRSSRPQEGQEVCPLRKHPLEKGGRSFSRNIQVAFHPESYRTWVAFELQKHPPERGGRSLSRNLQLIWKGHQQIYIGGFSPRVLPDLGPVYYWYHIISYTKAIVLSLYYSDKH